MERLSDVWVSRKSKMAAIIRNRNDITYISASIRDGNEISTAIPMFSGSGNTKILVGILSDVRVCPKSKMAQLTGCRQEITYISARTRDSNEIPTAKPYFRTQATRRD